MFRALAIANRGQASRKRRGLLPLLGGRFSFVVPRAAASQKYNCGSTSKSRPVRILVVAASFLPDLGGLENHVYEVTRRMATRADLDLTVLTTDRSGSRPTSERLGAFTVHRRRAYPRNRDYYFSPGIFRSIASGDYDLVHCQGIHTAVPVLAMVAARRRRIPYVVTFHTGGHSSNLRRRIRHAQWFALGPLLRRAAIVVAVSRFEQQLFQGLCGLDASRIRVIQNGGGLPSPATRIQNIPGRIISSGRLEEYKGHHRVVEAMPIVQRSIPYATLQILGSGPYEGKLRSLITSLGLQKSVTIEYISPGDRERMARTLGAAAAVAALSEYEANPLSVMEALALGIPAVGLDTTGIGDLIADGLVRGVPRNASATAIAEALIATLEEDREVSSSAKISTWDAAARSLAQVYLDAIQDGSRPVQSQDAR